MMSTERLHAQAEPLPPRQGGLDTFSRINRRSIALMNIARLGQHGAAGIDLVNSSGLTILTRLMIGDGLEFTRHLEIDLETFQNGDFELRPGLESCNLATVMREVFSLKDPRADSDLLEKTRRDLKTAITVLNILGSGKPPEDPELSNFTILSGLTMNFLKTKSDGYENVANNASEQGLVPSGIQIASQSDSSISSLDTEFAALRGKFSQGLLRGPESPKPDMFVHHPTHKRSFLSRLGDSFNWKLKKFRYRVKNLSR